MVPVIDVFKCNGCGVCASCGCSAPAYTLSLRNCARPRRPLGIMPHTAERISRPGSRERISSAVRSFSPPM